MDESNCKDTAIMALVINTNVMALNGQRNLNNTTNGLSRSLEKLSSGYRINRASDDAAGLAISEKLRAQIRGFDQASKNAQDGNGMLNIAEGSLGIVQENLQRMRELVVQAANGTNSNSEKAAIDKELTQLKSNIDQVANSTSYNGLNLLTGSNKTLKLQIGANTSASNDALNIGSAFATTKYSTLVSGGSGYGNGATVTTSGASIGQLQSYIGNIDRALNAVSTRRGVIGAYQNRLESVVSNLAIKVENISASESRIRNVDVAKETSNMTRFQILQQAAVSILSQANQAPQLALSLLR
jgi:flagellin